MTDVPNPAEIATIIVQDKRFDHWESVWVQHQWATGTFPLFRFTVAEADPLPPTLAVLQFVPGDKVTIYLGGKLAMVGTILRRQTAYDANSHGVELFGAGDQWFVSHGSIVTKDMNLDGMTFEQAGRKVIAPFGVGVEAIGYLDATPFKQLQVQPGEKVFEFLDRIARPRGITLGADEKGNVLFIGEHNYTPSYDLAEGVNIKSMQCMMTIEGWYSDFRKYSQSGATDDHNMKDAAHQEAIVKGSLPRYSPLLTPSEQPVWNEEELRQRAANEKRFSESTTITATVVVYGWIRSGGAHWETGTTAGELWRVGDKVTVNSPMAMLHGVEMVIITATFTQDSASGTLTTLELALPEFVRDKSNLPAPQFGPEKPATPEAPAETPPTGDPPAQTPPETPPENLPPSPYSDDWVSGTPSQ